MNTFMHFFPLFPAVFLAFAASLAAQDASPFTFTPTISQENGGTVLSLAVTVPKYHHLYADELSFELDGEKVVFGLPAPEQVPDKFSGHEKPMYVGGFTARRKLPDFFSSNVTLAVNFHGCSEEECYFPETRNWAIYSNLTVARMDQAENTVTPATGTAQLMDGFQVVNRASGFISSRDMLGFLDKSYGKTLMGPSGAFAGFGIIATVGLILLGGLALNLTPCVLPMIPINLAILGAGTGNGKKRRGFLLGIAYGAGMALAYGGLGLGVVLTGSKFGALNSSPWFNFAIAVVFVVMGVAMFDKLVIDFSRFQRFSAPGIGVGQGAGQSTDRGAFMGATVMGGFSALLAGACVAPVVISVLLLATTSYQKGNILGLLFPFVLGLGMALPWPFAASGLSFLPKPGRWMTRVKYGFGVIIFGFALWYGHIGWTLGGFGQPQTVAARSLGPAQLRAALETSRQTGQPVLVDFWASWCKNCSAMEHGTLRDPAVQSALKNYIVVKFQAEHLNDATIKPVLDELGVMGLPTFVMLRPQNVQTTVAAHPPGSKPN